MARTSRSLARGGLSGVVRAVAWIADRGIFEIAGQQFVLTEDSGFVVAIAHRAAGGPSPSASDPHPPR